MTTQEQDPVIAALKALPRHRVRAIRRAAQLGQIDPFTATRLVREIVREAKAQLAAGPVRKR